LSYKDAMSGLYIPAAAASNIAAVPYDDVAGGVYTISNVFISSVFMTNTLSMP